MYITITISCPIITILHLQFNPHSTQSYRFERPEMFVFLLLSFLIFFFSSTDVLQISFIYLFNLKASLSLVLSDALITRLHFYSSTTLTSLNLGVFIMFSGIQVSRPTRASSSRRIRARWQLLYTLVNNPSLLGCRKHFQSLQISEHVQNGTS